MNKNLNIIIFFTLLLFYPLFAQDNSDNKSKFDISFSERFRMVMWDNAIDLDKSGTSNQNFARFRSSLGIKYSASENLVFNLKFTHEFRKYFTPSAADFHMNEVIFDQLNLQWKTDEYLPGTLTFGRQNIFLGEGFVILDGHPGDGSRSPYFNAFRYDWNINSDNTLTGFFVYQPEEDFLPALNGKDIDKAFQGDDSYQLVEQSERGAGLYYTGNLAEFNLQSYFIWKAIADDGLQIMPKSDIYTFGARCRIPLIETLALTAEGSYQGGKYGDSDRGAYGGYSYLSFSPEEKGSCIPRVIDAGFLILSGDDINTNKMEAWDPLFSRWPKWSESLIYTFLKESRGRVAYWSNLYSFYLRSGFTFPEDIALNLGYYHLGAMENTMATSFLSGDGSDRGELFTAKLSYKVSSKITGHIVWEYFVPGDFYFEGAERSHWARMEFFLSL